MKRILPMEQLLEAMLEVYKREGKLVFEELGYANEGVEILEYNPILNVYRVNILNANTAPYWIECEFIYEDNDDGELYT